jgi:hypothetical protein
MKNPFLIVIIVLCVIVGYTLVNMGKAKTLLQLEIQNSNKQIAELQKTIELQKAEIENLKNLRTANEIDISPEEKAGQSTQGAITQLTEMDEQSTQGAEKVENSTQEVSQPMYGVYLGEYLNALKRRFKLEPDEMHRTYRGDGRLAELWVVQTDIKNVRLRVVTFHEQVFVIAVDFADKSKTNYSTIIEELMKKYEGNIEIVENGEQILGNMFRFYTLLNGVKVEIQLEYKAGYTEKELTLTYKHIPLSQKFAEEKKEQKASKVRDNL